MEIKPYEFQGAEYWINMVLTYGHILVVYVLMNRYQSEQDAGKKKKLMMIGVVAVLGWFFLSPQLKTHRVALEVNGAIVYQSDVLVEKDLIDKIAEFDDLVAFGRDDLEEKAKTEANAEAPPHTQE